MLRKAYPGRDEEILAQWKGAVGDKITDVPYDPNIGQDRVIDVAMGVIAKKWGQYNNFKVNLSARQDSETVAKVEESIRAAPVVEEEGEMKVMKPKTDGGSASKKSVSLTGGK
jgi:hypothetical protein